MTKYYCDHCKKEHDGSWFRVTLTACFNDNFLLGDLCDDCMVLLKDKTGLFFKKKVEGYEGAWAVKTAHDCPPKREEDK